MASLQSFGTVSYYHFVATVVVYLAVYETLSIKEWRDLENWVRGCSSLSRSMKTAPFGRP